MACGRIGEPQRTAVAARKEDGGLTGARHLTALVAPPDLEIDGRPVEGADSLQRAISRKRAGDSMDMIVFRGGRRQNIRVKLGAATVNL